MPGKRSSKKVAATVGTARSAFLPRAQLDREMVVPVNGQTYRVRVVPGPLLVHGKTAASRVRHASRVIEVDEIIPASDRWRVAALAVAYACRPRFHPVKVIGPVD